jgi:hypothetical protein
VSGNSTLLAHRRAFPFRAVPIAPFESRPFLRPLGEHRVAPQCFVPSVRSPLQATDASRRENVVVRMGFATVFIVRQ